MNLESLLPYIQIFLAIVLVTLILLQRSEAGLGGAFGGGNDDSFGQTQKTKRGFENTLFKATIACAVLFVISAITTLFI